MKKYPPTKTKNKCDDFSYSKHTLAFFAVEEWIKEATLAKAIRPSDKFMKTLVKYREECRKRVNKKPIGFY